MRTEGHRPGHVPIERLRVGARNHLCKLAPRRTDLRDGSQPQRLPLVHIERFIAPALFLALHLLLPQLLVGVLAALARALRLHARWLRPRRRHFDRIKIPCEGFWRVQKFGRGWMEESASTSRDRRHYISKIREQSAGEIATDFTLLWQLDFLPTRALRCWV